MTKRIRPVVQLLGAVALVMAFQACGGNAASTKGSGGATGTASGGSTGTGTGGSTGAGTGGMTMTGMGGAFGEPACLSTVAKGNACTATDQQFCYKTCGPEKTGVKTETCQTSGTYAEMSGCTFNPANDYSCYKIPTTANAACPAGVTPKGSDPCDVPHCTVCNSLGGVVGGQYMDSGGTAKAGWCTCQEANSAGNRSWTCASDTAWPCPMNKGC